MMFNLLLVYCYGTTNTVVIVILWYEIWTIQASFHSLVQGWFHYFLGGQVELLLSRSDLHLWKGALQLWCYEMHILIVCKAHMHAKLGGLGACLPRKFWNFRPSKIEFESIFDSPKSQTTMLKYMFLAVGTLVMLQASYV